MLDLINLTIRYVSYQYTISAERIASMHANECKNIKARYETLFNINIDQYVSWEGQHYKTKEFLMIRKANKIQLFLAVEQGARKFSKDIHIVINPRVKQAAKKWLR